MENKYSLEQLARACKLSREAVRHLIKGGFLPNAKSGGPNAHYTDEHVRLGRRIVALRGEGLRGAALLTKLEAEAEARRRATAEAAARDAAAREASQLPTAEMRDAVDGLVCVAAEALDVSPRVVRPALAAVLRRLHERKLPAGVAAAILEGALAAS